MNIGHTEGTRPPIPRNRRGQFKANQLLRQGFPPHSQRNHTQIKKVANLGGRIHTPKRPSVWNGSNNAKGGVSGRTPRNQIPPKRPNGNLCTQISATSFRLTFTYQAQLAPAPAPRTTNNEQRTTDDGRRANPEVEPSKISEEPAQAGINDSSRHVLDKRGSME